MRRLWQGWPGVVVWAAAAWLMGCSAPPPTAPPVAAHTAGVNAAAGPDTRLSGLHFMTPATQALQRHDSANPGMLWVLGGQQRFEANCQHCHITGSLRGVATRYPAFDAALGKPVTLAGRIHQCRQRHGPQAPPATQAPQATQAPWPWDSEALLELEAFVAHQSRGQAINPPADPRLAQAQARGRQLWHQTLGQLQLSCAQCHDQQADRRWAGSTIPQAHPTGYPLYRLEWQALGNLQRRLRGCMGGCMSGVRAEPFAFGADEWVALELYLMQRAAGMVLETPAVRP